MNDALLEYEKVARKERRSSKQTRACTAAMKDNCKKKVQNEQIRE